MKTCVDKSRRRSYAASWEWYLDGNVVSQTSCRFIRNMLAITVGKTLVKDDDDEDRNDGEDHSDTEQYKAHAGSLDLVYNTLRGIAAHDEDEGKLAFGRHAACIRLGSISVGDS